MKMHENIPLDQIREEAQEPQKETENQTPGTKIEILTSNTSTGNDKKQLAGYGGTCQLIFHVLCGILCLLGQGVVYSVHRIHKSSIIFPTDLPDPGPHQYIGFVCGPIFVLTGIVGFCSETTINAGGGKLKVAYIYMILSFVSILGAVAGAGWYGYVIVTLEDPPSTIRTWSGGITLACIIEIVVSIMTIVSIGKSGICTCKKENDTTKCCGGLCIVHSW